MTYEEAVAWMRMMHEARTQFSPDGTTAFSDTLAVLEREHEEAERYRCLREGTYDDSIAVCTGFETIDIGMSGCADTFSRHLYGDELDAAIDRARKGVSDE